MSKKRAFVRYTKSGEIVPGSLIITTNGGYPDKSSLWQEVSVDKCCGDVCPPTTPFCTENWAFENFDGTTFRNGDPIPEEQNPTIFDSLTTPAWCYYNGNSTNGRIYGKLYNWYAVNDPRGLAPEGWRVPSEEDFQSLFECLFEKGYLNLGGLLKSKGTISNNDGLWQSPNTGATNGVGFAGLPGGACLQGGFSLINQFGYWWTSTEVDSNFSKFFSLNFTDDQILFNLQGIFKNFGYSVRLIKDI